MKKDDERYLVDEFATIRSELGLSSIQDSERPDFICLANGEEIGIEVTRFFFPSTGSVSPQAVDGYRGRLSASLIEGHIRRGLPPLHVGVHLSSDQQLLSVSSRRQLADALLDFISAHLPSFGPHVSFDFSDLTEDLWRLGVHHISALRSHAVTKPFWSIPHAAFIPESRSSLIQDIVTAKSTLVAEYRKRVPRVWLLIVSGGRGLSSILDFDGDVLEATYCSRFDRLFLLRTVGPSAHELKQAQPGATDNPDDAQRLREDD